MSAAHRRLSSIQAAVQAPVAGDQPVTKVRPAIRLPAPAPLRAASPVWHPYPPGPPLSLTLPLPQVGLIGFGLIGQTVRDLIEADPLNGIEICFIHDAFPTVSSQAQSAAGSWQACDLMY